MRATQSVEDGIPTRERGNEVVRLWVMHRALPWAGMFLSLQDEELTRNPALAGIRRRTRVWAAIGRASRWDMPRSRFRESRAVRSSRVPEASASRWRFPLMYPQPEPGQTSG